MTLLNHSTLAYPDLERLILTYPETHGAPISDSLLTALILPRLDNLKSATSNPNRQLPKSTLPPSKSKRNPAVSDCGPIEMRTSASQDPEVSSSQISKEEQYLLLANHLLRRSPRLLPSSHKHHYANLLDRYLTPLLPHLTSLLKTQSPTPATLSNSQSSSNSHPKSQSGPDKDYGPIEIRTKKTIKIRIASLLSPTGRAILLTSDLFPYFANKAPLLQSLLSQSL